MFALMCTIVLQGEGLVVLHIAHAARFPRATHCVEAPEQVLGATGEEEAPWSLR
jgi:hypothetical protein